MVNRFTTGLPPYCVKRRKMSDVAEKPNITVAAGLIWRRDGMVLISKRPPGGPHAGRWELPGGKLETGEDPPQALIREIQEELGIRVEVGEEFGRVTYRYPEVVVTLIGLHAKFCGGEPQTLEVSDWRWVKPAEVAYYEFPEANAQLFSNTWDVPPDGWVE